MFLIESVGTGNYNIVNKRSLTVEDKTYDITFLANDKKVKIQIKEGGNFVYIDDIEWVC